MTGLVDPDWAEETHLRLIEFPVTQTPVSQGMLRRIWELRHNLTPYDAAYVALTEKLQAETGGACSLVTADSGLADAPGPTCPILLYPRDAN